MRKPVFSSAHECIFLHPLSAHCFTSILQHIWAAAPEYLINIYSAYSLPVFWLSFKDLSFVYLNMFWKFQDFLVGLSCLLSHPIKKKKGKWNDDWFDQFVVHRVTKKKDLKRGMWDAPLVKPPTWNHLRTQINRCHLASGQTTLPLFTHPIPVICFVW